MLAAKDEEITQLNRVLEVYKLKERQAEEVKQLKDLINQFSESKKIAELQRETIEKNKEKQISEK